MINSMKLIIDGWSGPLWLHDLAGRSRPEPNNNLYFIESFPLPLLLSPSFVTVYSRAT